MEKHQQISPVHDSFSIAADFPFAFDDGQSVDAERFDLGTVAGINRRIRLSAMPDDQAGQSAARQTMNNFRARFFKLTSGAG